ncbi:MAG: histidine phosphatase family protein [Candidatus Methanomethylicia archaeon]
MKILLIRHGETEWNVERVFRGRKDIPLSKIGRKQAELLGKYLRDIDINVVYSSPLKRALETAEYIVEYHDKPVEIIVDDDLIDINYGSWEGKSEDEVKEIYGELYEEWINNPHLVKFPNGESLEDVRSRLMRFIGKIVRGIEGNIAIVSHRVVLKVMICMLLGLDNSKFWNIRIDCGGITIFEYKDNKFILVKHNDISYLSETPSQKLSDF